MDNNIIKLLNIKDSGIKILQVKETVKTKTVVIEKVGDPLFFCNNSISN